MMKKWIWILSILMFSCTGIKKEKDNNEGNTKIPILETQLSSDTLYIGDMLELELSFSDTSILYYRDVDGSKSRIYPAYKINREFVENESDDFTYFQEIKAPEDSSEYIWGEIVVEVLFPHPVYGEGDVTISKLVPYTIINKKRE